MLCTISLWAVRFLAIEFLYNVKALKATTTTDKTNTNFEFTCENGLLGKSIHNASGNPVNSATP